MKSLILKDIYNISHNTKQMIFLLIFMALCFVPGGGINGFIVMCSVMCSMMTMTTFSFDETSKWEKYALIMPVTRKDYVISKYVVGFLFSLVGTMAGIVFALVAGVVRGNIEWAELLACTVVALFLTAFVSSFSIVLIFKFGAEKARMVIMASIVAPCFLFVAAVKFLEKAGVVMTDELVKTGCVFLLLLVIAFVYAAYRISLAIFEKKEF